MSNNDSGSWPMSIPDMIGQGYPDWYVGLSFRIAIRMQAKARQIAAQLKKEPKK